MRHQSLSVRLDDPFMPSDVILMKFKWNSDNIENLGHVTSRIVNL